MSSDPQLVQIWGESDGDFFARIDSSLSGWPLGMKYVSYYHSGENTRPCSFGNVSLRNEWWTTLYSSDDYYMWKLSSEKKKEWEASVRRKMAQEIYRNEQ